MNIVSIDDFLADARKAIPGVWLQASIEATTGKPEAVYAVVVVDDSVSGSGKGSTPQEAIMKCREKFAHTFNDELEKARALVAKHGP